MWHKVHFETLDEALVYARRLRYRVTESPIQHPGYRSFQVKNKLGTFIMAQRIDGSGPVKEMKLAQVLPRVIEPGCHVCGAWIKQQGRMEQISLPTGGQQVSGYYTAYLGGKSGATHEYLETDDGTYHRIISPPVGREKASAFESF